MPVLKSSKKSLRVSARRQKENLVRKKSYRSKIRQYKNELLSEDQKNLGGLLGKIQSSLDKAAKTKTLHKNKAARIKSKLAKALANLKDQPVTKKK